MIKKFIKIQNVSRFSDFSAHGNISFDKVSIIYGENSAGKTTLTSIVRSLLKNEPDLILKRKTCGKEENPYIEILYEENQKRQSYKFQDNKWSSNLKDIEIFDIFFINENVYTGLEISSEHQRRLYQFVLWEEGVALAKEIEEIKKDLQTEYGKLDNLKEQIELVTERYFTIEEFVELEKDENITEKIESKELEIKIAKAGQEIKEKQILTEISSLEFPIDFNTLKDLLQRSIKEISKEFLEKVEKHKEKLDRVLGEETEPWLQQGLLCVQTIQDGKCPFCQLDLKGAKSLIEAYEQYFNEEYKKLKQDISRYLERINGFSIEGILNQKKSTVLKNDTLIEFWRRYLPSFEIPKVDFDSLSENIRKEFSKIGHLVKDKSKNIMESADIEAIDNFITFQQELNSEIEVYNSQVRKWNDEMNTLKERQLSLGELKKEFKKLEIEQKRYSPDIVKICDEYKKTSENIKRNKELVEEKRRQHDAVVSQKIGKYGEEINQHLGKFGVCFKIRDTKTTYRSRSKEPYLEYGIAISEWEIDLEQQVKHFMGEGDKNALAFAFFLAKISLDEQIANKIVIFDDPVSSLDRNRRRRTVEYIRDLANKAKQIIVLTHNDGFAFGLYNTLKEVNVKPKTLQIYNGKIKEWDIEEQMKHPYFIRISRLERFLDGDEEISLTDARKVIRLVLEDALKFRYFKYFQDLGDNCWLRPMINRLWDEIKKDKDFKFKYDNREEALQELGNLCDFSSPSHHSNIDRPHREEESPEEIKGYVKSTLKVIYEWL